MSLEGGDVKNEEPRRRLSEIESYIRTVDTSDAIRTRERLYKLDEELEILLQKLAEYRRTKKQVTIPILGGKDEFLDNYMVNNVRSFRLPDLRARFQDLPPFEGQPMSDKINIMALGERLGLLPRQYPDNYLYKSSSPDELYQGQQGHVSVVYNCFKINRPGLPDNTYWHEAFAGDNFGSYINGVAITVNRSFSETVSAFAKLKNFVRRKS